MYFNKKSRAQSTRIKQKDSLSGEANIAKKITIVLKMAKREKTSFNETSSVENGAIYAFRKIVETFYNKTAVKTLLIRIIEQRC